MNRRIYQNNELARMSNTIVATAARLQRLDLARLGRAAEAAWRFQDILADLKCQIARKATLRATGPVGTAGCDLQTLAA